MIPGKSKRKTVQEQQIFHTLFLLRVIISTGRLYSMEHQKTREMIREAYTSLNKALNSIQTLTILIIDQDVIINNKAIRAEEAEHFSLFIAVLKEKNIGHIAFKKGIAPNELLRFLTDLAAPGKTSVYNGAGITCGPLGLKETVPDMPETFADHFISSEEHNGGTGNPAIEAKLRSLSSQQLLMAQELYFSIRREQGFDLRGVRDVMSSFVNLFSQNLNPLSILTTLKNSDEYTFTHLINVCILTLAQAESLGFREQHLYEIGIAATLYDIGKTFIPEEILKKAGKLDREEQKILMEHPMKGSGYLLGVDDAPKLAVLTALEHHIHFGSGGYPNIGNNWKTNIVSQMIAISDTYDAMRCTRPYRRPSSEALICNMLRKDKGAHYNPYLVNNFLKILKRNTLQSEPG